MNRSRLGAVAALIVLAMALSATQLQADGKNYKIGDKVANFAFKDAQGKTVSLAKYKGKIIVLNMFATW